jgi:hypothetical protein
MPFLFWLPLIVMRGMWGIAHETPQARSGIAE